ncbi:MAG TPA: nitrate- and nitrite sensing domain-containing protein [Trebonia sp.]|nr:nitrate- and nitrite sensing domain-containing protein [Trebonia sp.]
MTNGNGGPPTSAPGLPVNGAGSPPQGGSLAVGQGPVAPGAGAFSPAAGQANLPVPVSQPRRGGAQAPAGGPAPRRGSPFSISNWRVRWRLIAIITVPTVTALILGVIQIIGSVGNYTSFKRVQELASLNSLVVQASGDLADERDAAVGFVAAGGQLSPPSPASVPLRRVLQADISKTNVVTSQITALAGQDAGAGFSQQTSLDLSNGVLGGIQDLPYVRQAALSTKSPALSVILYYERVIQSFTTFSNDIAAGTANTTLQSDVSVLNALLRIEDDASLQRAYLYQALQSTPAALTPGALQDLNQAAEQQVADTSAFNQAASVTEQQTYSNTVAGPQVDEAKSAEKLAVATASANQPLTIGNQQGCTNLTPAQCWQTTQSTQISLMRQVSNGLVTDITTQANALESSSMRTAIEVSLATLILLIVVLLITTFVARSMIRPLRKLRADALEVAGSKLPDMVRRLSESEGGDTSAEIEPIGVTSTDEIGEVARAFDQVHREAVRLAADEAMLRGNLNAMFVNLSRRSQSLIERQLSLIDSLEQTEQDADRLSSLFRLDHLATRMRRNSENLLVLAGHEAASRRWSQPVPLVDVLRAAVSEIEQYERVVLNVQPGIQVVGQAVNDVVHLVAEIVENATTFSPEDTQVYVTGQPLTSGGVLLDITDNGVGISEQEMAHANWRLDNPPVVDVAVSRRMGLFVVGRLAARHGVRVRLRHAQSGGLTALIWLPESVAAPESSQPLGRLRKFEADDYGPAPSLSAPTGGTAPAFPSAPVAGGNGSGNGHGNGNGFTGAAATAARIPRLGGGPASNGANGNGSFSAFGAKGGARPAPPAQNGPNGAGGGTIEAPGGSLPVRTPGNHPLGPAAAAGGPAMFGGDGFTEDFATTRLPAIGGDGGSAGTGPVPSTSPAAADNGIGGSGGEVAIPPAVSGASDQRLPIFDSLESDWFRRSGKPLSSAAAPAAGQTWNSPADEGWRAARIVTSPEARETTTAGLPKRVPRANLVPGSVGGGEEPTEETPPTRSADTIRNRMSSFQRGVREARAAGSQNEEP